MLGVELLIGTVTDPVFGPLIACGSGGVLVDGLPREEGYREVAAQVFALLSRHRSNGLDQVQIESDIRAGMAAYDAWKYAQSRCAEPAEVSHQQFWSDFVAADWPRGARLTVTAHAVPLCNLLERAVADRPAREGMFEIVERLADARLPLGLISNSLGANCRRELLSSYGLDQFFGVQLYSDEVGIRNALWFAWRRRPLGSALRWTAYMLRAAPAGRTWLRGVGGALRGLPWLGLLVALGLLLWVITFITP